MKPQIKTLNDLLETFNKRLQFIYSKREANNISQLALLHLFQLKNKVDFIMNKGLQLQINQVEGALTVLNELEKGKPIQHIVGKVEFANLVFRVNEHVLIPRPETEELVYLIKNQTHKNFSGNLIDIGTGSGCIPISLKFFFPNAIVSGIDISEKALEVAAANAKFNNLDVVFHKVDILKASTQMLKDYDLIVSNPPYIPINEQSLIHQNVLDYEPELALFTPNNDPLLFYRKILELAKTSLNPNGRIYFELHENFAFEALNLAKMHFANSNLFQDMQGKSRFLVCHKTS